MPRKRTNFATKKRKKVYKRKTKRGFRQKRIPKKMEEIRERPLLERSCKITKAECLYNDYIVDIWYLIAEHIKPEDVGRFASICTKTRGIVESGRFWKMLYQKYYRNDVELPDDFKPHNVMRLRRLRANVIRSLFYTYPPFIERAETFPELNYLQDQHYVSWAYVYDRDEEIWIYCHKFSNGHHLPEQRSVSNGEDEEENERLQQALYAYNNVFENPQEGLSSLIIYSTHFIPVSVVILNSQMYIRSIRKLECANMANVTLELKFSYDSHPDVITPVVYPNIFKYKIFNWWDTGFRLHR